MKTYAKYVDPYLFDAQRKPKVPQVIIADYKRKKVADFIERLAREKAKEDVHITDAKQRAKRFETGFLGEAALEQFLGFEFMDTSVGQSEKYAVSDLRSIGVDAGVKTGVYENNKFFAINKGIRKPQVICWLSPDKRRALIAGLATVEVLNTYVDDDLIMNKDMSGRKTGFYGFHKLIPFNNLGELAKLSPL